MKKFAFAGVAVAALALAIPALAQQGPERGAMAQPMSRAAVQANVQARFARSDADRDGYVTQAEAQASRQDMRAQRQAHRAERRGEMFARLDANGDNSISRAEFDARGGAKTGDRAERRGARAERRADRMERRGERRGQRGAMMGRMGARGFQAMDMDKDGRVSIADATAHALARFDRIDANRDGMISADERQAARAAMRGQRQQRRGS